jgi:hypothetical protein
MVEIRLPDRGAIGGIVDTYKAKLEAGVLPPDPLRMLEFVLRTPPTIEHMLPVPPVLETIHAELTSKVIEALPRLPMTSEPPVFEWKRWIREEFRL